MTRLQFVSRLLASPAYVAPLWLQRRMDFVAAYCAPQDVPLWGWCSKCERYEPLMDAARVNAFVARGGC